MDKKEVRLYIKQEKVKLSVKEIEYYSNIVIDKLLNSNIYQEINNIYTYVSYNQEIKTIDFIKQCFLDNKKVAVPKVDKNVMNFHYINSFTDLKEGYYNILEPINENIANDENVLFIMPGLAFDTSFNRIGYGGGFYDRYLDNHNKNNFIKIGLGYDFQLFFTQKYLEENDFNIKNKKNLGELPIQFFDKKVDIIITPQYFLKNSP